MRLIIYTYYILPSGGHILIAIGLTWLITWEGGEALSTVGMKKFNLRSSQVRKGGNIV